LFPDASKIVTQKMLTFFPFSVWIISPKLVALDHIMLPYVEERWADYFC